jgi:hypothetical protein
MKNQLWSRNKVTLALDGRISTNKLAITAVIAYYLDRNWAMQEGQLLFDKVDNLFISYIKY